MDAKRYPIERLLPHAHPMILIDELQAINHTSAVSLLTVKPDCILLNSEGQLPAVTGIEWMAQTIAAQSGYLALEEGKPVEIGFLLGTRRYRSSKSAFNTGEQFTVKVDQLYLESGMASFSCEISQQDEVIVTATINTYQPEKAKLAEVIGEPSE